MHSAHPHPRQWTVFLPPSDGEIEHTFRHNISSYCVVHNLLSVYIYHNGWLKCNFKSVTYNNNRLWLGSFRLIVLNLKDAYIIQTSFFNYQYMVIITKDLLYNSFSGATVDLLWVDICPYIIGSWVIKKKQGEQNISLCLWFLHSFMLKCELQYFYPFLFLPFWKI